MTKSMEDIKRTSLRRAFISLLSSMIIISSPCYSYKKLSSLQDELDKKQKIITALSETKEEQTLQQLNEESTQLSTQPLDEKPIDLGDMAAIITALLTGIAAIIAAIAALMQNHKQKKRSEELNNKQQEFAKKLELESLANTFKDIIDEKKFRDQLLVALIKSDIIELIKKQGQFMTTAPEEFEQVLKGSLLNHNIIDSIRKQGEFATTNAVEAKMKNLEELWTERELGTPKKYNKNDWLQKEKMIGQINNALLKLIKY